MTTTEITTPSQAAADDTRDLTEREAALAARLFKVYETKAAMVAVLEDDFGFAPPRKWTKGQLSQAIARAMVAKGRVAGAQVRRQATDERYDDYLAECLSGFHTIDELAALIDTKAERALGRKLHPEEVTDPAGYALELAEMANPNFTPNIALTAIGQRYAYQATLSEDFGTVVQAIKLGSATVLVLMIPDRWKLPNAQGRSFPVQKVVQWKQVSGEAEADLQLRAMRSAYRAERDRKRLARYEDDVLDPMAPGFSPDLLSELDPMDESNQYTADQAELDRAKHDPF